MKEKLTRNIGLKILSVILAALLWLVITNVEDPIVQTDFKNVTVEILNADELTDLGQIYEITEGATVDISVAAKRSIVDDLNYSDFRVTADLSKLSDVNATKINVSCPRYEDKIKITSGLNEVLKVNLEKIVEKRFKVNVEIDGQPPEGYYVYEKSTNAMLVRVSGPKTKMERISAVVASVKVSDMSKSFTTSEKPYAVDEEGNKIDDSNLQFSANFVSINVGMYKTKTIDLNFKTKGKPADGYLMTNLESEPKTIEVAAEEDVLNQMNELTVTEDISNASRNIEKEINIQEQLPDGVYLVGDNQTAVVNITIEKADTKEITIWPGDINVRNQPEALSLTYLTTGPISVLISGPKELIEDITRDNLKPYIDISNYSGGTYAALIGADLKDNVTLSNAPSVSISLGP
jgi:YbbR domain-containing protein